MTGCGRTCEVVVHVRGNAIRPASAAMPHVVVRLAVVPPTTGRRWRAGRCGRDRSDPPLSRPGVASAEVGMCTSIPPSTAGRSGPPVLAGRHRPVAVSGACSRGAGQSNGAQPGAGKSTTGCLLAAACGERPRPLPPEDASGQAR